MRRRKPACTYGPPLMIILFILVLSWNLQVEGRPYKITKDSECLSLSLTHPKKEFLEHTKSKVALPEKLKSRTVLTARNESIFAETQTICEATGTGIALRHPLAAEQLLTTYTGHSKTAERPLVLNKIKGAAVVCSSEGTEHCIDPAAFLFTQSQIRTLCLFKSVLLVVTCPDASQRCYQVNLKQEGESSGTAKQRFNSRHILAYTSREQHKGPTHSNSYANLSGVMVGVVGLLLMFFILVLCAGGGDKYDPSEKKLSSKPVSSSGEVAMAQDSTTRETDLVQDSKTNGTSATISVEREEVTRSQESVEMHSHGSMDHDRSGCRSPDAESPLGTRDPEAEKRARALSAPRSFDPLPELPKLELAGEPIAEGDERRERNAGGDEDDDDDDPYDVVPENNPDRMSNHSHSGSEGDSKSPERHPNESPLPVPYGKVSRHAQPGERVAMDESDSYAEVRDVLRSRPQPNRDRSHTSPIHAESTPTSLRDRRVNTESATHMPLPRIPGGARDLTVKSESSPYNRIRGEGATKENGARKEQTASSTRKRDQLYESVDEVGEKDLYESVPDDLSKMDSPGHMSASSLSPIKNLEAVGNPPPPPSSPLPSSKTSEIKKRALEKTLSASNEEGKRRFSFFGRKKTASVSNAKNKKGEVESPVQASPSSPLQKSPPLPNIPAPPLPNDDEEEDTYDKVTPGLAPSDNVFQQGFDHASKSMSLPMAFRTGARSNLPLPRVPEDSGSATVIHKRVLEEGVPDEYDRVHLPPAEIIPDEPNYDTVDLERGQIHYPQLEIDPPYDRVDKEELMQLLAERERAATAFDPPYDKVDQDKLKELREQEKLKTSETALEGNSLSLGYSVVRGVTPEGERGKVEVPGSLPEHDEEGYAVVPAEFRMRKRAMSANQDTRKGKGAGDLLSPDSVADSYKLVEQDEEGTPSHSPRSMTFSSPTRKHPQSPKSSEDQYASVNLHSKREDRQRQELEESLRLQEALRAYTDEPTRSVSPIPPPLPPAPNPEDLMDVEERPPIPAQMEGINELVAEGEGSRAPPDSSDPPYAKVRSKVDNPYAVVNQPYTEIDVSDLMTRIRGGESKKEAAAKPSVEDDVMDDEAGYDVIGKVGVKSLTVSSNREKTYDTIADIRGAAAEPGAQESPNWNGAAGATADQPYDTIADLKNEIESKKKYQQDLPMLETASETNIYDCLLPESPAKSPTDQPPRSMV